LCSHQMTLLSIPGREQVTALVEPEELADSGPMTLRRKT
jgi:hypothetical protein